MLSAVTPIKSQSLRHIHVFLHVRRIIAGADVCLGRQRLILPVDHPRENSVDVPHIAPRILPGAHSEHLKVSLRVGLRFTAKRVRCGIVPSFDVGLPEIYFRVRKWISFGVLEIEDEDVDVAL